MIVDVPFGLIPLELDEVYPLAQNDAPKILDLDSIEFIRKLWKTIQKLWK